MQYIHWRTVLFAILVLAALPSPQANAQASQTWVSGVGDDANPCSRLAPCRTFASAITKTAANGQISVLDPGNFGTLFINKSITVSAEGVQGNIIVSVNSGININVGATDKVVLRGLDIEGITTASYGVSFSGGGVLHIDDCTIRQFKQFGVNFIPNAPGAELYVTDSKIAENGAAGANPAQGAGINFSPASGGNIFLDGVTAYNNQNGIVIDGTASTAASINATLSNVAAGGNANAGILAKSTNSRAGVSVMVDESVIASNAAYGIWAEGTTTSGQGSAVVAVSRSTLSFNATALNMVSSGAVQSFGNNQLFGNGGSATPFKTPNLAPQ